MEVFELAAMTDYRLQKLRCAPVYITLLGAAARAAMDETFLRLTGYPEGARLDLPLLGRVLTVPQAIGGVARFSFDDLCRRPLGAADFLELAAQFHTLFVDDAPVLKAGERNEAKRFIMMIDALYDAKVKLVASAAAEPAALGAALEGAEKFEFARTSSRLIEMRSLDYLAEPHGHGKDTGDLGGLIDT